MLQNLVRGLLLASLALAVTAAESPPLKVAFVYVSPVGEAGWSYQHDQGRKQMEQALGARVQTTVVESVAEGPDAERVLRDLARQGHKLIFATSFGYLEPAQRVAAEFPEVAFEQTGGYKTAVNLNTYNARYYEARYLAGLLAGRMSRSGVAGYVAGFPVPEVIQGINAFALGMRAANPTASVKVVWLDAWFDPARERDAATVLVNQGADLLTNHSGSTAVAQVAEERRVGLVAYQSDMRRIAPRAQWTAIVHQWGGYYTQVTQQVIDGRWRVAPVWGGMKDGFMRLAPLGAAVPAAVAAEVRAREADLVAGRLHPFGGRIVDNAGHERQVAGTQAMPDDRIQAMNFLVQGVVGSLPAR
jgi:simple sugar transport system substrate-binding protein